VRNGRARDGLALAMSSRDDAPRLIIPLVRIDPAERTSDDAGRPTNDTPPQPAERVVDQGTGIAARPSEVALAWARLSAGSADLVMTLDAGGRVLAMSPSAAELIVGPGRERVTGRHLLDVLDLVDFNPTPGDASMYADRIPPLLAVASNTLSRGLLRVRAGGRTVTLDAVAAPLHDASGALVATVCFLSSLSG